MHRNLQSSTDLPGRCHDLRCVACIPFRAFSCTKPFVSHSHRDATCCMHSCLISAFCLVLPTHLPPPPSLPPAVPLCAFMFVFHLCLLPHLANPVPIVSACRGGVLNPIPSIVDLACLSKPMRRSPRQLWRMSNKNGRLSMSAQTVKLLYASRWTCMRTRFSACSNTVSYALRE
jgi:hypothetical protein